MGFVIRSNMGRAAHLRSRAGLVALLAVAGGALGAPPARADLLADRLVKALAVPHLVSSHTGSIAVDGPARVERSNAAHFTLAFMHSAKLSALVRYMGVESDNFTAEMLLKQLGAQDGGHGTSASGAAVVTAALRTAGIPLGGVRVVDGSGLSLVNRLTAASLVTLLQTAWFDPDLRASFIPVLPVAGVSGTLRDRLRTPPARGRVLAKTGTTNGASTLAGYVTGHYAFAVLHNGQPVAI